MQLHKYGLILERLSITDIELVRNWRNTEHVKQNMMFQQHISSEMQEQWFNSLSPEGSIYFLIIKDGIKIGVINLKGIDQGTKSAEAGIFIGNTEYLNTMIPVLATISIMELAFEVLQLTSLLAHIGNHNEKAILFNQSIGYQKNKEQSNPNFSKYTVTKDGFYRSITQLKEILSKINDGGNVLYLTTREVQELHIDNSAPNWQLKISA